MENKKKIAGRYTLVLEKNSFQKIKYNFKEYNNEKVPLAVIDNFTTNFANKDDLFNHINDGKLIKDDFDDAYITYQANKQLKTLPVVYSDNERIKKLSLCKDVKIDLNNQTFIAVKRDFLEKIHNFEFRNFFSKISEDQKLREYIYKYTACGSYAVDPFNRKKIIDKLKAYKQCREAILIMRAYENEVKTLRR